MNVKNIIIAVVGIGITTIFISNCSGSPPISVEMDRRYDELKITSLVDNVGVDTDQGYWSFNFSNY
jgi:hypothetical protein